MAERPDLRPNHHRGPYQPARDLAQAFGRRLNDLRQEAHLTMRDLAADAGLPPGTVSALCAGRHLPNLKQLLALQRGLKLGSIEELLGTLPSLTYEAAPRTSSVAARASHAKPLPTERRSGGERGRT